MGIQGECRIATHGDKSTYVLYRLPLHIGSGMYDLTINRGVETCTGRYCYCRYKVFSVDTPVRRRFSCVVDTVVRSTSHHTWRISLFGARGAGGLGSLPCSLGEEGTLVRDRTNPSRKCRRKGRSPSRSSAPRRRRCVTTVDVGALRIMTP